MLVNCAAYQHGEKLADIGVEEIPRYISRENCFVWVALREPTTPELVTMQKLFNLHPLAVEDASHGHQRPKLEEYGDDLFVVLHLIEPDGENLTKGEISIFVGHNYVLSVRRNAEQGFADVRARSEREPDLLKHGPAYVLYALMDSAVDRYFPILEGLAVGIDSVEERIFAGETSRETIEALYELKRRIIVIEHASEPLIEVTGKLHGGRVPALCVSLQDYFRDVHDHLLRLNRSINHLREAISTAVTVNVSFISVQENEVVKRFAGYGALVAIPTMIAGIYGMNFQNMPLLHSRVGFSVTIGVMAVMDIYMYYRFRKAGWL
ncbi:MAG: magnesium/cobalt transporter CorA [Gemmatimonadota bacterium]